MYDPAGMLVGLALMSATEEQAPSSSGTRQYGGLSGGSHNKHHRIVGSICWVRSYHIYESAAGKHGLERGDPDATCYAVSDFEKSPLD